MKEYQFQLDKGLTRGLRPDERNARNTQFLTELRGMRPTPYGLDYIPTIENLVDGLIDWPFPQLIQGKSYTFKCEGSAISYIDETTGTETALTIYDGLSTTTPKVLSETTQYHLIDAYGTWMLLNDGVVIWKSNLQGITGDAQKVLATDSITIKTGCYHKGRCFYGGLTSDFWNDDWQEYMSALAGTGSIDTTLAMDTNFVYWTGIGGGDMLWPIFFDLAINGNIGLSDYGVSNPAFIDAIKRNSFGWTPLPTQGAVLALIPLGDHVIAYCQRGVFALSPVAWPQVGAIGVKALSRIGCGTRSSCGGSMTQHVWIDLEGFLWTVGADLKVERLGYREFLQELDLDQTVISVDHQEQEFYICDDQRGFLLTKSGMCEINEFPTSLVNTPSGLRGLSL